MCSNGRVTYLLENYSELILKTLRESCTTSHFPFNVSLTFLARENSILYNQLLDNPRAELEQWDNAAFIAQKLLLRNESHQDLKEENLKWNCHVRFCNMPTETQVTTAQRVISATNNYPKLDQLDELTSIRGTVVRMLHNVKFLVLCRTYQCPACKHSFMVKAEYEDEYMFVEEKICPESRSKKCKGRKPILKEENPNQNYTHAYQEIVIENISNLSTGLQSITVTLEDDLVNTCQPGDTVVIVGTVELRGPPAVPKKKREMRLVVRANSMTKDAEKSLFTSGIDHHESFIIADWMRLVTNAGSELTVRDQLVQSICPTVHGMNPVKLAIALSLASCVPRKLYDTGSTRNQSHILLTGDPGLAKSKLLRSAADLSERAIFTTGTSCSVAGLTAAAVRRDDREVQLEAGALVLADGGVCCVDEFNLMSKNEMNCLHEAMEQQTVNLTKANVKCTLATRCAIIASCNPAVKHVGQKHSDLTPEELGIDETLISRFDLVLVLRDRDDELQSMAICDRILSLAVINEARPNFGLFDNDNSEICWTRDALRCHFRTAQLKNPVLTADAKKILGAYFMRCRADSKRLKCRVTNRLLESLYRLTKAHARLLLRDQATTIDALVVLRLMESSIGMEFSCFRMNLTGTDMILGPNKTDIDHILTWLNFDVDSIADIQPYRMSDSNLGRNLTAPMSSHSQTAVNVLASLEADNAHRNSQPSITNCNKSSYRESVITRGAWSQPPPSKIMKTSSIVQQKEERPVRGSCGINSNEDVKSDVLNLNDSHSSPNTRMITFIGSGDEEEMNDEWFSQIDSIASSMSNSNSTDNA